MKIVFNLMDTGLGNNGGSHTLVQSANILQKLGEEVIIADSGNIQYTWDKVHVNHKIVKDINEIKGDVIIATGINSLKSTNNSNIKKKYHWIRGWETWKTPENKLIELIRTSKTKKIVNSICLQNKLKQYHIESTIVRPGHTFEDFYPLSIRNKNQKVILGGLYNEGKKRENKRTFWIFECFNQLKTKYDLELWMFGSDGIPQQEKLTKYFKNPTFEEKNKIYNQIDIWLSTSCLEGLHISPAEAMLAECCVCGNNSEMNGTQDYLIHNITGLVSDNNINNFILLVEFLIRDFDIRLYFSKQGRNKIKSMGNRIENMINFINILKN